MNVANAWAHELDQYHQSNDSRRPSWFRYRMRQIMVFFSIAQFPNFNYQMPMVYEVSSGEAGLFFVPAFIIN